MENTKLVHRKRVALFLGAGASKTFGLPLTSEIFGQLLIRCKDHTLFKSSSNPEQSCSQLLDSLGKLLPGLNNARIQLPLITDVISLIDYSLSVSVIPITGMNRSQLQEFRDLLAQAVAEIVCIRPWNHPEWEKWTRWLHELRSSASLSVLTSNYDIVAEHPILQDLWRSYPAERELYAKLDYGCGWCAYYDGSIQPRPHTPEISFFKLHGSVNWLTCEMCQSLYIHPWVADPAAVRDRTGQDLVCCKSPLVPVIVTPSLVRDIKNSTLLEIWKNALQALRDADEWIIVGYSFPPEDLAIRSMFLRAWQSRAQKPRVTVVQKPKKDGGSSPSDQLEETESRFCLFFPECTYLRDGLEGYLSDQLSATQ